VDKPLKSVTHGQCDVRPTVTFPPAWHHLDHKTNKTGLSPSTSQRPQLIGHFASLSLFFFFLFLLLLGIALLLRSSCYYVCCVTYDQPVASTGKFTVFNCWFFVNANRHLCIADVKCFLSVDGVDASIHPLLHMSLQWFLIAQTPSKVTLPVVISIPLVTFFLGPPESISQAATRSDRDQFVICSDVFVRLTIVFNRQTDRQTTLHL